jgi:hypothetical protein
MNTPNSAGAGAVPNALSGQAQNQHFQNQLNAQMAALPADVRAYIANEGIKGLRSVLPTPYWSTVRFQAARTGAASPFTYTIDTTVRKAFAYAIGQPLSVAGFDPTFGVAQPCDTNLLRQSETIDNADVWMWGLALEITPDSEPVLAAQIWRQCLIELSLNGTTSIRIGTPAMFPSGGGLYGAQASFLRQPDFNIPGPSDADGPGQGATASFISNGNPISGSYYRFPQPFKWASVGSNSKDTSLVIQFTPNRVISETVTGRPAVPAAAPGVAGPVAGFTPPDALAQGTYVDIRVRLISVAVNRVSQNV